MLVKCLKVQNVAKRTKQFTIQFLDEWRGGPSPEPGRYVTIVYPDLKGKIKKRNYSIISYDEQNKSFEICVKMVSETGVSASLHESLKGGGVLNVDGVGGDITFAEVKDKRSVLMLSSGVGATLPMALVSQIAKNSETSKPSRVHFVTCAKRVEEVVFLNDLLRMEFMYDWFSVEIFLTEERVLPGNALFRSGRPRFTEESQRVDPNVSVLCGSKEFIRDMEDMVKQECDDVIVLYESFGSQAPVPEASEVTTIRLVDGTSFGGSPGATLLDTLEENNIKVSSKCRMGICGSCKVKLISGDIESDEQIALSPGESEQGYVLACCSYVPSESIELDPLTGS